MWHLSSQWVNEVEVKTKKHLNIFFRKQFPMLASKNYLSHLNGREDARDGAKQAINSPSIQMWNEILHEGKNILRKHFNISRQQQRRKVFFFFRFRANIFNNLDTDGFGEVFSQVISPEALVFH